jgi:hypothetical protein
MIIGYRGHRLHSAAISIFHLKNGRFCYRQADTSGNDNWYWLCNSSSGDYYTSDRPLGSRLPPGTAWRSGEEDSRVASKPDPEEEEEVSEESAGTASGASEGEVVENESGQPTDVDEGGSSSSSDDSSGGGSSSSGGDDGGGGDGGGGGDD